MHLSCPSIIIYIVILITYQTFRLHERRKKRGFTTTKNILDIPISQGSNIGGPIQMVVFEE